MTPEELFKNIAERRKELGLSLEEVVEKTKLYPSVVRDIEAGNLENINSAYRKGFVRIYASFLSLDTSDALDKISSVSVVKKETRSIKNIANKPKVKFTIPQLSPQVKKIIIFILAALFILWILGALINFIGKRISRLPPKPAQTIKKETPAVFINQPKANKEVNVSLTAKRTCFLRVKVDGKLVFESQLPKGAVETWKGNKEIELKISDGSAVYLEVNSKRIPPLTASRKPIKSLKITAAGISVVK
jgi:transcriptional regulator with XRE-family HTH domain